MKFNLLNFIEHRCGAGQSPATGLPAGERSRGNDGDPKGLSGHHQTSFFETIDEQRAIVLARIAEVRIWKNYSLTWTRGISLPPVAVPSGLLTRPLSHSDRGLRKKDFCEILNISSTNPLALSIIIRRTDVTVVCEDFLRLRATP